MANVPFSSSSTHLLVSLVILQGLVIMPYCAVAINILYSGDSLSAGQLLVHENYVFTIQRDCNLVLYDAGSAVWASGTNGGGTNCRLTMQGDGNLVVYDGNNKAVWASNTRRSQGNYVLIMQRDRNVVIYGGAVWATGTNRVGTPGVDVITKNVTQPSTAAAVDVVGTSAAEPINRKIVMVTEN